jgi:electron transfer flavoprotein-quinone oxidoreductase
MSASNYDVVIVGAGAAGLTAAIGLARAGFAVAVLEAAAFPGAENWSGCVYFCENLAHPDILGEEGVEALAWERRLVERGFFATDGHGLLGMKYRDPEAFRHCYTVLRPIYDHHLAQVARRHGAALLTGTTAESLIRDGGRVAGVSTSRGPLYADLVFLAEGDASHLVTREGYERHTDLREAPKFLQGIKEVLELPPRAVEQRFGVGAEEGVAYEMLVRNGTLRGKPVRLNMGGFVYTNRQSLSVGLVLPADNLAEHFDGDPNLLLEWFEGLPALRPWLEGARRSAFGAKIIRGGGARDIPTLIDEGLAVGGAASAIGIDFPYPNFTGPATAMGLLLTQAAVRIRGEGGGFTRAALERHYLEPLRRTSYWRDVEFLRHWPGYVKKTRAFFGRNLDLALGSAYLWTRSDRWLPARLGGWFRMLRTLTGPGELPELRADAGQLAHALRLKQVAAPPSLGRLLLDGSLNALRDLLRQPRAGLPPAGEITLHYTVAGGAEPSGLPPASLRRWFARFAPVLASAARRVYANDGEPLDAKLPAATRLLVKQISLLDGLRILGLGLVAGLSEVVSLGWARVRSLLGGRKGEATNGQAPALNGPYAHYAETVRRATDLTPVTPAAAQAWDARLARLTYDSVKASHIHVLWPQDLAREDAVVKAGLWHVCPAHVYEARPSPGGAVQVVVNFENCIKCETCWRTSDLVDWGRDGRHRFVYAVHSPAVPRLLADQEAAGLVPPALPRAIDPWAAEVEALRAGLPGGGAEERNGEHAPARVELDRLLTCLERKLIEFETALDEEPRTLGRDRAEYLHTLARYARNVAWRVVEVLSNLGSGEQTLHPGMAAVRQRLLDLANAAAAKAEDRARHALAQRFAWAAGDSRQLRQHHLAGLSRLLPLLGGPARTAPDPLPPWLRAEQDGSALAERRADWQRRLDAVCPTPLWRQLERQEPLTPEQDALVRELLAQIPALDSDDLAATLHPPERKALLAELGWRDPSLAYRAASHLWARDLAALARPDSSLRAPATRWQRGEEWAAFALLDTEERGEALFVPASGAGSLLLLRGDRLALVRQAAKGLTVEPLATLGLRGAGLARVSAGDGLQPDAEVLVERDRLLRLWSLLSSADLVSIASGMADLLCRRAIEHATTRVQFPGLFHDEEARDAIGKFGAIKRMVADMAARRYLIETLDHALSPRDLSTASIRQAALVKALAAEALGTAPGSVSYNAGQIFGGTGYSEDDILSKLYRDASAWRFLGPENPATLAEHGARLLDGWDERGDGLSRLPGEVERFDEIAQRNALQGPLDALRAQRALVRSLVGGFLGSGHGRGETLPLAAAEARDLLGRQDAYLLGATALLLRTHARLEQGLNSELEIPLLRVWLESATAALDEFEDSVRRAVAPPPSASPLAATTPVTVYADFLAAPLTSDSGDFLVKPSDLLQPRYVPEMIETDPRLAAYDAEVRSLLTAQFGWPRDGLVYERYLEREHRPDDADLDFLRRQSWFRMPIPKDLGGEAASKVVYYLMTTETHRLADGAISLTIQVNSSLGTTPVLLPRDKDLPRAQRDLAAFAADTTTQNQLRERLEQLAGMLEDVSNPQAPDAAAAYQELHKKLQEAVLAKPILRVLAHRFIAAWQEAGRAGLAYELPGMRTRLREALTAWQQACGGAAELLDELERRRRACDLFLRWVATGQISAFALTEPSAGSDTARVATRARLRSVPVEDAGDGGYRFVPAGESTPRTLLDADRLEFRTVEEAGKTQIRAFYRWSDAAEPSPVCFDEYDYETDDPGRMRYIEHGGRKVPFTDIAQLRRRDGKLWYDYWELNGAKMWITNGRVCGIMALYAKTDEGVTGFIVDRHAEGLVVGKDEAKMGQLGSPTNELALQAVRVPRENVIGLEGRGQVNALETLTVGRAGLGMSAMAQMIRLDGWARDFAAQRLAGSGGRVPDWAAWKLARLEEDRFVSEAVAHEVIGKFEHKGTKSIRLESAVSKMLVSELLHRIIETAEDVHGLEGQTERHLVEKRKRDARVLTIYEGTNEIQRFFILRDVAGDLAGRWPAPDPAAAPGSEARALEEAKGEVRQRVLAAVEAFGAQLAGNPNLQANCFLLSEAVGWLGAAASTLGRVTFLDRLPAGSAVADAGARATVGRRALARCLGEIRGRLRRFDGELAALRRGHYSPAVRAASLLFQRAGQPAPVFAPRSQVTRPLSVLVVLDPPAPGVPQPRVADGRLLEPYRVLGEADRAALETALRLRDAAEAPVTIQVAAVGPASVAPHLREALSLGVERARLVLSPVEAVATHCAAGALATVLEGERFDLVLSGAGGADSAEGLLGKLTAAALGVPHAGAGARLAVRAGPGEDSLLLAAADGTGQRLRALPAAVAVEAGLPLRPFSVEGYLTGLARAVDATPWPAGVEVVPFGFVESAPTAGARAEKPPQPLLPHEAGQLVLRTAGVHAPGAPGHGPLGGEASDEPGPALEDTEEPSFGGAGAHVLAVLAAEADGRLRPSAARTLDAARFVAQFIPGGAPTGVLLVVPADEEAQRRAASEAVRLGPADVCLLVAPGAAASDEVKARVLAECWAGRPDYPAAVVAEPWAEEGLANLAARGGQVAEVALRVRSLERERGRLVAENAWQGKLRAREVLTPTPGRTCWVGVSAEVEVGAVSPPLTLPSPPWEEASVRRAGPRPPRVRRWAPRLESFYGRGDVRRLLEELKQGAGVARLSDAEFVLDVGFGVGNRDGYEAVIEPLERALRGLGVRVVVGGSRKVTEELHLLPADRQIGQSGVSVNPRILLAVGVSGAPQHLNYIGPRATVVAFNRDPEAPIMTLNQRQAKPRVFPVVGDLFETVPAFTAALETEYVSDGHSEGAPTRSATG